MPARVFRRSFPARGPRRQTTWVGPADQAFLAVATTGKTLIASFTPATTVPSLPKPTLIRTRGVVSIAPQSFAADVIAVGAYGVCVVSQESFIAGAASIPGPFNQSGWDGWVVWGSFSYLFESIDGTGALLGAEHHIVDSKAMRKMGDEDVLVFMAESQSGAFKISMPLRLLFKLS